MKVQTSFDSLLIQRPNYLIKNIQPLTSRQPSPVRNYLNQSPCKANDILLKKYYKKQARSEIQYQTFSIQQQSHQQLEKQKEKLRVTEAFNKIADFSNRNQIFTALKALDNANERKALIDKILIRKEEQKRAQIQLKARQLAPIFRLIYKKLKKQDEVERLSPKRSQTKNQKKPTFIKEVDEENPQNEDMARMEQLQSKLTTSLAFKWLSDRRKSKNTEEIDLDEDKSRAGSLKKRLRRNTKMVSYKNSILESQKKQKIQKVSENSEQMIQEGKRRMEALFQKKINIQEIINKAKAKVKSRRITFKEKQKLIITQLNRDSLKFFSSERQDSQQLERQKSNFEQIWYDRQKKTMIEQDHDSIRDSFENDLE